ncbi:Asx homology domain-containing protein [Annulohypoxylon maeteangense]|uniref:Asx homology domain-containing protein n=1 Tax=Annulohypoxylon maeteangense TaxID=1927788 RepID=UPI0020076B6C|nr:Asx homology domain-containing protein [Annulohypoxylon maeteangense]KAI0884441.1 Asx homology domain-containing protein [Annulohypoxylon maeteangense]
MPPRKKNSSATANNPIEATRRSTRNTKRNSPVPTHSTTNSPGDELPPAAITVGSSEDEISSTRAHVSVASGTEYSRHDSPDELASICVNFSAPISYASSRPSTANSDGIRQPGVLSTPASKKDIVMPDVGDDEGEDELSGQGPVLKKTKSAKDMPASTRKSRSKYDNPDEMLTNPRAPLAKINLRDLLCNSKAWDVLSPDEKKSVLDKFPDEEEVLDAGTEKARPNIAALRNNDNFRHDAAQYREDLRKGWHDPEWIRQAQAAHRRRAAGDYNEYLATRFEDEWAIPMTKQSNEDNDKREDAPLKDESNDKDDNMNAMEGIETNEGEPLETVEPKKEDGAREDGLIEHPPDTIMVNTGTL